MLPTTASNTTMITIAGMFLLFISHTSFCYLPVTDAIFIRACLPSITKYHNCQDKAKMCAFVFVCLFHKIKSQGLRLLIRFALLIGF